MNKFNLPIVLGVIAIFIVVVFWSSITVVINPGEAGVLFKPWSGGIDKTQVYTKQGYHFKAPWNKMIKYNVKQQNLKETIEALSSNGLKIVLELTVLYRVLPQEIGFLHEEKGVAYREEYISPSIRSSGRTAIGKFIPEELYSTKREEVVTLIKSETAKILERRHIVLEEVLIRNIQLPSGLAQSIEEKLKAEQAKQRANQEADRLIIQAKADSTAKMIEATTNAETNRLVNASLNDKLLRWKGIQATLKLAESPNSKTVIIRSSKDGLPLILGNK